MIPRDVTDACYLVIGALCLGLGLWSSRHPGVVTPLGQLIARLSTSRAARLTLALFWCWVGWHFFVTPPTLNG